MQTAGATSGTAGQTGATLSILDPERDKIETVRVFVGEHKQAARIHNLCEFLRPEFHGVRHQAALCQAAGECVHGDAAHARQKLILAHLNLTAVTRAFVERGVLCVRPELGVLRIQQERGVRVLRVAAVVVQETLRPPKPQLRLRR